MSELKAGSIIQITDTKLPDCGETFILGWKPHRESELWSYIKVKGQSFASGYAGPSQFKVIIETILDRRDPYLGPEI
jgi:hypothetical protein